MSYSKKELKNYLKGLLKDNSTLSSFMFEYKSGHTAFHTRLRINISSDKIVHSRIPRGTPVGENEAQAAKVRELDFSVEQLKAFVKDLIDRKIWDLDNCTERALPGTALLSFAIRSGDELLFNQEIWESCRNDNSRTKDLLRTISARLPADWTPP